MYKIMVVDDEKIICNSIKSKIERIDNPYISEIVVAYNGENAIRLVAKKKVDIMIIDIKMPKMTGIEVIEYLSKNNTNIRFMVLSGYDDYQYVRKAFKLGVYDYLLKPISIINLKERLEAIIGSIQNNESEGSSDTLNMIMKEDHYSSGKSIIDVAKKYVDDNYNKNITLAELSNMVSMNYSYFSQLFKEETGKTFSQYLTQVRMEKAVELLKDPLYRIGDISNIIGYNNPYHFSRAFKSYYGIPPKEYRKKL